MRLFSVLMLVLITVQGCATPTEQLVKRDRPLYDELFPTYAHFALESEEEVFALSEEAKHFVARHVQQTVSPHERMRALLDGIFSMSGKHLSYANDANYTASQTFERGTANCLSLSIMAYAMADYAGFTPQFYWVDIPEYWTRRDGFSLLNGHINLSINIVDGLDMITLGSSSVLVDFDPQEVRRHFPRKAIPRAWALAMYYNNRGADMLLANAYTRAYAYFRRAVAVQPTFTQAWVNLGVLYRMQGHYQQALSSYEYALQQQPENLTIYENMAVLYRTLGDNERATELAAFADRKRQSNPFYHFILGEEAFERGEYALAHIHYLRAMRLDTNHHEILFGLSKALLAMGDIDTAAMYLERARSKASSAQDKQRYQGKLAALHAAENV